jgi:hypothetical protein
MKNKDRNPIYYKSAEEMDKPVNVLFCELRNELTRIRGKLHDIQMSYGWKEQTDYIEGSLTCLIIALYHTISEIQKYEDAPQNHSEKTGTSPNSSTTPALREIARRLTDRIVYNDLLAEPLRVYVKSEVRQLLAL